MERILAFDYCSVSLLFVLLVSLFLRKMIKGRSNIMFLFLVLNVLLSGVLDIICFKLGDFDLNTREKKKLIYIFTYSYFFVRNLTAPMYLLYFYSAIGLWYRFKEKIPVRVLWCVLSLSILLFILDDIPNHRIFYIDSYFHYQFNDYQKYLYALIFVFIIFSVCCIVSNRKMIRKKHFWFLLSVYPIAVVGVVIQMIFPRFVTEVFSTAFPLLLLSLKVQRPEEKINNATGALSYSSCLEEITKNLLVKRNMQIIFIKITNQKKIKNQFGIDEFHVLLKRLSDSIHSIIGNNEIDLYYLETGTFAVVSVKKGDKRVADFAEKICNLFSEKQNLNNLEIALDFKMCVVKCPSDIDEINTLMSFANSFHHIVSKENQITYLEEEAASEEFEIRSNIDELIKKGLENDSFEMYYQPVYDIEKRRFTSAEALIRLKDEKYHIISPKLFIPAAERSGAIHAIGDKVLESVCRFISECDFKELGLENISINLSVAQCIETDLATKILMIMGQYGIDASKVVLEITDSYAEFNHTVYDNNIKNLSMNGIHFSLDDYGAGYSNIKRIMSLPVDIIKLDKSFAYSHTDSEMSVIISHTVNILKKIDRKVLIKGVEDAETLNYFFDAGCDYIQGYYYSKPLKEQELIEFLKKENK